MNNPAQLEAAAWKATCIVLSGPQSQGPDREGIERPAWYLTLEDDEGKEIAYARCLSYNAALKDLDTLAERAGLEAVNEGQEA